MMAATADSASSITPSAGSQHPLKPKAAVILMGWPIHVALMLGCRRYHTPCGSLSLDSESAKLNASLGVSYSAASSRPRACDDLVGPAVAGPPFLPRDTKFA